MENNGVTVAVAASTRTFVPQTEKPDREKIIIIEEWKQTDFLCKGYILSALKDDLCNFYSAITTSIELWDELEKKNKIEDACLKKFVELQLIPHNLIAEDMVVNEDFQVDAMIEKLPPPSKHIIKYLKKTRDYMLVYHSDELVPIGYTDSDFQSDIDSRKSTSGNVFTLGGGAIAWRSIKQTCVADSTMEAEYVAVSEAAKEAV
nr:uncharacterized protein LOC112940161 [Solanum lycopersicum]